LSGEEWMSGRMNTLPFIGSNIQITLSLGSRKKDSCAIQVNDRVSVLNHGNYWIHTAKVKQIDEESGDVKVKWDSTGTFSVVCLDDIERIEINENSSRIRNYPDYFSNSDTYYCQQQKRQRVMDDTSMFMYSALNPMKLCAEGSMANLLICLRFEQQKVDEFWKYCHLPIDQLWIELGDDTIPKRVMSKSGEINKLEKLIWIVRNKKFGFMTTKRFKENTFNQVNDTFEIISGFKFPILISVTASDHHYKHVVVIWNKMIIDYEQKNPVPFTKKNLAEICGEHNRFRKIDNGYGLFPSQDIREKFPDETNWGEKEYMGGLKKKYFLSM